MDDIKLLELAAKAAGYQVEWVKNSGCFYRCEEEIGREQWDPLEDDGDALRLAVKLRMNCDFLGAMTGVIFIDPGDEDQDGYLQEGPRKGVSDTETARRAIIRAAAEIGRAM